MPKIVDHDQRRADILSRALSLFAQEGFGRVSMRALAAHLGVSTGVLYHYFEGKEALFAAMLRHLGKQNVAAALSELPDFAAASERLDALMRFLLVAGDQVQQVLLVSIDYARAHPDDSLVSEVLDVYRQALVSDFAEGDRDAANVALSFVLGVLIHRALDPAGVDLSKQLPRLADLLSGFQTQNEVV